MKGIIISVNPHIVKVKRFEIPSIRDYHEDSVEWENAWNLWDILASANWELPVHEESLKLEVEWMEFELNYYINQPVTIKEIKNGKAILL